jgi:hypothetical protein
MNAVRSSALTLLTILTVATGGPALAEESAQESSGGRSKTLAVLGSAIGTAVPVAIGVHTFSKTSGDQGASLILAGYMFGPSVGHFYANRPNRAFGGMALRLIPVVGLGLASAASWDSPSKAADALAVGSGLLATGLVLADIARVSDSVRAHNAEHAHPRVSLGVVPGSRELTPAIRVDLPM